MMTTDPPADGAGTGRAAGRPGPRRARPLIAGPLRVAGAVLLGCLLPALVAVVVHAADARSAEGSGTPPVGASLVGAVVVGALLVAVVVAAGTLGRAAGWGATGASVALVWWWATGPEARPPQAGWSTPVAVTAFTVTAAGSMLLLGRLDRARRRAAAEEQVTGELLDQSPVAIALLDRGLRFVRVNRALAALTGAPPDEHPGRRASELNARVGATHEPVLAQVVRTGTGVSDRIVSERRPTTGSERHWRTSYFPVRATDGTLQGVGVSVEEVTADVVARRRSELLLGFARELASVHDVDRLGSALSSFLARALEGRALAAVPTEDVNVLRVLPDLDGYRPEEAAAWGRAVFTLDERRPLTDAARSHRIVAVPDAADWDRRYPDLAGARTASGDEACVCVPVVDPVAGTVLAVFRVSWPHRRELTETTRTLCETVASITASALKRIQLVAERAQDRFRSALEAMLDDVAIGEAVRDDGRIVDFRIVYVSAHSRDVAGRSAVHLVGRRLSELYPGRGGEVMLERLAAVVETGLPEVVDRFRVGDLLPEPSPPDGWWSIRVSRLGDGFIGAWRNVTDAVRLERAEREAERVAEREAISVELLQRAALPVRLPAVRGLTVGAHYRPASEQPVGGDWFDAFPLDDESVALVIADVAGHGTDSAAAMVQVRNVLRALAVEHRSPGDVLRLANRVTARLTDSDGPFVTACYGVVDVDRGTFSWALAGHPPPLRVRAGAGRYLDGPRNPPLAVTAEVDPRASTVGVRPGDRLVLFTDGLVERRGEIIDDGLVRLAGDAVRLAHLDAQHAAEHLGASVVGPQDDIAVLVVDVGPDP